MDFSSQTFTPRAQLKRWAQGLKPFSHCLHSLISALTHLRPLSFQAYIKNLRCLCSKVLRKVDGEVVNIGETGNPERKRAESGARLLYHVLLLPEFKTDLGAKD